jgi:hypothetical protein
MAGVKAVALAERGRVGMAVQVLFSFDAAAAGQVNASFLRRWTLSRNLTRYIVAFPGAHELLTALTEPRHAGRGAGQYWFAADVLTSDWEARRVEEAVAKGARYSARLHVEVDTVRAFDAVGRTG